MTFITGDCSQILPTLPAKSFDLVLTDPPYFISSPGTHSGGLARFERQRFFGDWDIGDQAAHQALLATFALQSYRLLKPSGTIIVFYDLFKIQSLQALLVGAGFRAKSARLLTWQKSNPMPINRKSNCLSSHSEYALVMRKGSGGVYNRSTPTCGNGFDLEEDYGVFRAPIASKSERCGHPTAKSPYVIKRLLELYSKPGDAILDPFCGSQVVLTQAKRLGREATGIDLVNYRL